ncbi:uncharacterized protein TRAVEDRAFT_60611 [Trametes versicolor FP-101664 SS1]|uniref:uncharacterized protein n=1 Tax=Trametes versicolor (strain FP-101664) TaxID=717944 RepID=UPI0004622EA2|nr:uncharacterized protein TRAVEDRAFT_60611 [Trametes versicolor FP-101664 SS1]EIW54157.1 hypothetical protein TRAVEDRAFT_60611 [Trametes versicolor FP-101664 SS1]
MDGIDRLFPVQSELSYPVGASAKMPPYVSIGKHMPVRLLRVPCLSGADDEDLLAKSAAMTGFLAQLLCRSSSIA